MSFENITVVLPTCQRPERLEVCLRALPKEAGIIVSDDSLDDRTKLLIEAEFPWVRWTRGPCRGPAANRNHGARLVTTDWIAFIDDDCIPQPGWLEAIDSWTPHCDVIEGRTVCPGKQDNPSEEHVENLHGGVLWSCNFAIRKHAFDRLGGFDEDFLEAGGEDMEFAWRVKRHGLVIRFVPEALVLHPPRTIGFRKRIHRMMQAKWGVLYMVKTGEVRWFAFKACVDLLRTTYHFFSRYEPEFWRTRLFQVAWRWLTFPFVLPYSVYWHEQYRLEKQRAREQVAKERADYRMAPAPSVPGVPTIYERLAPFEELFAKGLPILAYHKIARPNLTASGHQQFVPPAIFREQLQELCAAGYQTVSLADALKTRPWEKHFVLTFDDGYETVIENALPVLEETGCRAIMFLVPRYLGKAMAWQSVASGPGDRLVSQTQVREWLRAGHEIGCHSMTHPMLTRISLDRVREEVTLGRKLLEDMFGAPIVHFSYPYGEWDPEVVKIVRDAGYETAVTTDFGVNDAEADRLVLRRILAGVSLRRPVNWSRFFRLKKEAAGEWSGSGRDAR